MISERFEVVVHDDKALYKYQILYYGEREIHMLLLLLRMLFG